MHDESRAFVAQAIDWYGPFKAVLDVGGRNVNGTYRDLEQLLPVETYFAVDKAAGEGVDQIIDFAAEGALLEHRGSFKDGGHGYVIRRLFDLAICTNVFEHEPRWRQIPANVAAHLAPGGIFIVTVPGPAFPTHCDDGSALVDGVFYEPGNPEDLSTALVEAGFSILRLWDDPAGMDLGVIAVFEHIP